MNRIIRTAIALAALCVPTSLPATVFTVTTQADETTANGQCSLREAIDNANDNAQIHPDCPAGEAGEDRIVFAANVDTLLLDAVLNLGNFAGNAGLLVIDGSRDGLPDVTLDGGDAVRVFLVGRISTAAAQAEFTRLRIVRGRQFQGGAMNVLAQATARLSDCVFLDNTATFSGGAIYSEGQLDIERCAFVDNQAGGGSGSHGGALDLTFGTARIANSTFADNHAVNGAAIRVNHGHLTLLHSSLSATTATLQLDNSGSIQVLGSVLAGENACVRNAGSVHARHSLFESGVGCINGIHQGVLHENAHLGSVQDNGGNTLTRLPGGNSAAIDALDCNVFAADFPEFDLSVDQRHMARPQGARCDLGAAEGAVLLVTTEADETTANGQCSLREAIANANDNAQTHADCGPGSADSADAIRFAPDVAHIVLTQGQLILGHAAGDSGALGISGRREGLPDVTLDGNDASRVFVVGANASAASEVALERLRIVGGNDVAGGAIYVYPAAALHLSQCELAGNLAQVVGGAIENNGELHVNACSFTGNTALGTNANQGGGAIFNTATGTALIERSTVSDNDASNAAALLNAGTLRFEHSTLSGNLAGSGNHVRANGGQLSVTHSTLAASTGTTFFGNGGVNTFRGSVLAGPSACQRSGGTVHGRYSLIASGAGCINGDDIGTIVANPGLGTLQDNGGGTLTHLPNPDSPAVDAVECDAFPGFDNARDQRGVARPGGLRCDIGSVEREYIGEFVVQSLDGAATGTCTPDAGNPLVKNCTHLYQAVAEANLWPDRSRVRFADDLQGTVAVAQTLDVGGSHPREWLGPLDEDGRPKVALSGSSLRRVLVVQGDTDFLLQGLAVVDGFNPATAGAMYVHPGARVRLQHCEFSRNHADLKGGAIENIGQMEISDCDFDDNFAGDGEWWDELSGGGAIFSNQGDLDVEQGRFRRNRGVRGGAIYTYRGAAQFRHSLFEDNYTGPADTPYPGGAIHHNALSGQPLRIEDSTFVRNTASLGGAVRNINNSDTTILRSRFSDNLAAGGGALHVRDATVSHSLFNANHADGVSGGGAILVQGGIHLMHSTVSGNSASASNTVGGIRGGAGPNLLLHSTVVGNTSTGSAALTGSNKTLIGTVLADNPGGDCDGTVLSLHSLVADGSCTLAGGSDGHLTGPALLGPLQDNGGTTLTHRPEAGSPLLDGIDCDAAPGYDTSTDQRGVARPQGLRCDIGAMERELFALNVSVTAGQGSVSATSPVPLLGDIDACSSTGGDCEASYDANATVTLNATPELGWTFTGWGDDCTGLDLTTTVTLDANKTCTAQFGTNIHVITTQAVPAAGGTVSCDPNPVPNGQGTTCTFSAHPGYQFTGWGNACASAGSDPVCTLTNVTSPRLVTANFVQAGVLIFADGFE